VNEKIEQWYQNGGADKVVKLSDALWARPETAFQEEFACKETAAFMKAEGFSVSTCDVKTGKPSEHDNCVVARWGTGRPVIGFLAEYDALPGLGQEARPVRAPKEGAGHGCGHNMMAGTDAGGACALKAVMEAEKLTGTLVWFGCPAEETLSGKVWMASWGAFNDLDIALSWHANSTALVCMEASMQASTSAYFSFHGKTAHAAAAPQDGRSALDACELMNVGVNYLREHMPQDARIHYVYEHAGEAPNIVPDFAETYYYVRARSRREDDELFERVVNIAKGAALMTGTTMEYHIAAGSWETFICHELNKACWESAQKVPQIVWDDQDREWAKTLYRAVNGEDPSEDPLPGPMPPLTGKTSFMGGSSDVGDVSVIAPTVTFMGLGTITGVPLHHWAVVSTGGSSIGHKSEIYAGKVLAQCGYDLLKNPSRVDAIKKAYSEARKSLPAYKPCLPN
jgi:aminobenzoyl-glutamate utilization protein B